MDRRMMGWMIDGFKGSFISSRRPLIYVTDGHTDDEMDDERIQGKLHFISTSFNICNEWTDG